MPACSVSQPVLCPISSTINTRLCDAAVVCIQSMVFVAISTADWKPKLTSVPTRSLSIVLGSVTTLSPSLYKRLAVLCVPLPPNITRQSSPNSLYVCFIASTLSLPFSSGSLIFLNGVLDVPSMVPPIVNIPEKSLISISLYVLLISPLYPSRKPYI